MNIIDFYADWCAPCKTMSKHLSEIESELGEKISVSKINVDNDMESARKYGIRTVPTLILLKENEECDRIIGVSNKDILKKRIEKSI